MNESGNWIVFFFKEKITLKHLKIVRSSDPRVPLYIKNVPYTHFSVSLQESKWALTMLHVSIELTLLLYLLIQCIFCRSYMEMSWLLLHFFIFLIFFIIFVTVISQNLLAGYFFLNNSLPMVIRHRNFKNFFGLKVETI